MNQKDLAEDYINNAKIRLKTAENVIEERFYAFCFRLCQEATELSLKAALRLVGIDFPKWHDIGALLKKEQNKFPENFQDKILRLAEISEKLTELRELAMYGDEKNSKPASSLFNEKKSKDAIKDAKYCIEQVENLFDLLVKENKDDKFSKNSKNTK